MDIFYTFGGDLLREMEDNSEDKYNFESVNLVEYIAGRKKPLLIVAVIALIISTIIAFTIKPKFKSSVVLFPASSSSISQALLTPNIAKKDILKFGEEEDVEQLIQILNSYEIRDRIIAKYKLLDHYKIDPAAKNKRTKLYEEYEDNISFTRTEFMSIKIDVLDTDPQTASNIANDIAAFLDTTINRMQRERAYKAFIIVEKEYTDLKRHVKVLKDSLKLIQGKGVFDYESQSEVFNQAYATAIGQGKKEGARDLEEKLKILALYGAEYASIRDLLVYETEKLSNLETKYRESKVDLNSDLPHKYIVNKGIKAEEKSYPIRWLIIVLSTFSAFLVALLSLIIFDNLKKKPI